MTIGKNCDIHSGAVIGHDGFGYTEDAAHNKTMVKHFGGATIDDDVLIGDNVCVVRGTIDDTFIDDGVKIDNMSHVAHNCRLEKMLHLHSLADWGQFYAEGKCVCCRRYY